MLHARVRPSGGPALRWMPTPSDYTARMPPPHGSRSDSDARIGHGYDLHRLEPLPPAGRGRPLIVGGIALDPPIVNAAPVGPVGHSDADALFHAITDALLGALGQPDIGQLFPDTDPRHDSQDSRAFVQEAARRVVAAGYTIANLDATVILERPKIGPRKEDIRRSIAGALAIDPSRVNVKGKTHEGVDAVGEGRAIEVHAVVLLVRAAS